MRNFTNREKPIAVIVDAYGAARSFPFFFNKNGVISFHIQSTSKPLPALSVIDTSDYYDSIVHQGDVYETATRIRKIANTVGGEIICVIPGVEPGVILADQLSEILGVVTNGTHKSSARRDKFLMAEMLSSNMVSTPSYFKSSNLDEIISYAKSSSNWPLVIKPLNSAGSNGVFVCNSIDILKKAYAEIIGKTNNMGIINEEVLIQSFLSGSEYMVNSVSHNGVHYTCDIWYARKIFLHDRGFIYDRNELLPASSEISIQLTNYTKTVLDALDIKNGPSHAEVIITSSGPVLVEVGARISGVAAPDYHNQLLGHNQVELAVESYVNPEKFLSYISKPYQVKRNGMQICLISKKDGMIKSIPFINNLNDLVSLYNTTLKIKEGDYLRKTIDLSSCPGFCDLIHDDRSLLETEYGLITQRFAEGVELEEK